jgi:hypothetical protein
MMVRFTTTGGLPEMSENSSEVLSSSQPRVGALKAFFRAVFGLVISGVAIWIFPKIPVTRSEFGLKVALIIPLAALATIWVPFLTFCKRERKRPSAWLALLFTSLAGMAALWAVTHLTELQKRSLTDMTYENCAEAAATMGFIAALVWFVRSRNLCAVGAMITAVWISWVFSLSYPF